MSAAKPIIVIKKKSGHGGHHGGAWKVAYADFVTAMMSLFIVLWLMNTSEKVRQAVAGYFNDPRGKSTQTGTDQSGSSDSLAITKNNIPDLKRKIEEAIRKMNDLSALQNQIQITITPEGLRIELLETKDGTFFDTGSAALNQNGRELLTLLARELGGLPNRLSIEGHTDAQPYASPDGYGNWELSTDRANAARRLMQLSGLHKDQISQVRGYADEKLRVPSNPMDPSNRRISVIVQYLTIDSPPVAVSPAFRHDAASSQHAAGVPPPAPGAAQPPQTPAPPPRAVSLRPESAQAAPAHAESPRTAPISAAPPASTPRKSASATSPVPKPSAARPTGIRGTLTGLLSKFRRK